MSKKKPPKGNMTKEAKVEDTPEENVGRYLMKLNKLPFSP
jgi:hypothetical protein